MIDEKNVTNPETTPEVKTPETVNTPKKVIVKGKQAEKKGSKKGSKKEIKAPAGFVELQAGGKTPFGHRLGTFAQSMDEILESGKYNLKTGSAELQKRSGKDAKRCVSALKSHRNYLASTGRGKVFVNPQGMIKAIPTWEAPKE